MGSMWLSTGEHGNTLDDIKYFVEFIHLEVKCQCFCFSYYIKHQVL